MNTQKMIQAIEAILKEASKAVPEQAKIISLAKGGLKS